MEESRSGLLYVDHDNVSNLIRRHRIRLIYFISIPASSSFLRSEPLCPFTRRLVGLGLLWVCWGWIYNLKPRGTTHAILGLGL